MHKHKKTNKDPSWEEYADQQKTKNKNPSKLPLIIDLISVIYFGSFLGFLIASLILILIGEFVLGLPTLGFIGLLVLLVVLFIIVIKRLSKTVKRLRPASFINNYFVGLSLIFSFLFLIAGGVLLYSFSHSEHYFYYKLPLVETYGPDSPFENSSFRCKNLEQGDVLLDTTSIKCWFKVLLKNENSSSLYRNISLEVFSYNSFNKGWEPIEILVEDLDSSDKRLTGIFELYLNQGDKRIIIFPQLTFNGDLPPVKGHTFDAKVLSSQDLRDIRNGRLYFFFLLITLSFYSSFATFSNLKKMMS